MAQGIVKVLPASTHQQILVGAGNTIYPSLRVLNPNDGVCYVSRNRDCLGTDYGSWDWKIPSQSYGMLPGPFQSAGVFYLDQSGAGRQGEVTLYPSLQKMDEPVFMAIGRAIAAAITTMDIVQGSQPGNPPVGTTREWSDANGLLYALLATGANRKILETGQVAQSDLSPILDVQQASLGADIVITAAGANTTIWTPFTNLNGIWFFISNVLLLNNQAGVSNADFWLNSNLGQFAGTAFKSFVTWNAPVGAYVQGYCFCLTPILTNGNIQLQYQGGANGLTVKAASPVGGWNATSISGIRIQ